MLKERPTFVSGVAVQIGINLADFLLKNSYKVHEVDLQTQQQQVGGNPDVWKPSERLDGTIVLDGGEDANAKIQQADVTWQHISVENAAVCEGGAIHKLIPARFQKYNKLQHQSWLIYLCKRTMRLYGLDSAQSRISVTTDPKDIGAIWLPKFCCSLAKRCQQPTWSMHT